MDGPDGPRRRPERKDEVTPFVLGMLVLASGFVVLAAAALWVGRR
jgi:hypothetical protein